MEVLKDLRDLNGVISYNGGKGLELFYCFQMLDQKTGEFLVVQCGQDQPFTAGLNNPCQIKIPCKLCDMAKTKTKLKKTLNSKGNLKGKGLLIEVVRISGNCSR